LWSGSHIVLASKKGKFLVSWISKTDFSRSNSSRLFFLLRLHSSSYFLFLLCISIPLEGERQTAGVKKQTVESTLQKGEKRLGSDFKVKLSRLGEEKAGILKTFLSASEK